MSPPLTATMVRSPKRSVSTPLDAVNNADPVYSEVNNAPSCAAFKPNWRIRNGASTPMACCTIAAPACAPVISARTRYLPVIGIPAEDSLLDVCTVTIHACECQAATRAAEGAHAQG